MKLLIDGITITVLPEDEKAAQQLLRLQEKKLDINSSLDHFRDKYYRQISETRDQMNGKIRPVSADTKHE